MAAKSETHMATAFLEAIFHDIPGGTSVLATSMSHLRTTPSPGLPRGDQRHIVAYRDVALRKSAEALRNQVDDVILVEHRSGTGTLDLEHVGVRELLRLLHAGRLGGDPDAVLRVRDPYQHPG